jgi:hypothetical protein
LREPHPATAWERLVTPTVGAASGSARWQAGQRMLFGPS